MKKKILCAILSAVFIFTLCSFTSTSNLTNEIKIVSSKDDNKVYCNATIDDDFADDCVVVVINKSNFV